MHAVQSWLFCPRGRLVVQCVWRLQLFREHEAYDVKWPAIGHIAIVRDQGLSPVIGPAKSPRTQGLVRLHQVTMCTAGADRQAELAVATSSVRLVRAQGPWSLVAKYEFRPRTMWARAGVNDGSCDRGDFIHAASVAC